MSGRNFAVVVIRVFLFVVVGLQLASGQTTYHIKPTSEPECLTLMEFAYKSERYISTDTTLLLLSGVHELSNTVIFLENIDTLTIMGSSASFPDVTSIILCTGYSAIILVDISYVGINALTIESCGSNWITIDSYSTVYNLTLSSITSHVLPAVSGISITKFDVTDCRMERNYMSLFSYNSTVTSQDNTFESNTGKNGGALLAHNSGIHFTGHNLLESNKAAESGGAKNSSLNFGGFVTFVHNHAGKGGGISVHYSNITATDTSQQLNFSGNIAHYHGGGLQAEWSDIYLQSFIICINNTAVAGYGGAGGVTFFFPYCLSQPPTPHHI